jgi:hypothetical protein
MRRARFIAAAVAAAALAACGDPSAPSDTGPKIVPVGSETFSPLMIRAAAGAPSIANPVVSFTATKGVDVEAVMWYRPRPGRTDSTMFVRFRVGKKSLLTRPDGSAIADGESVQITMTLVDPQHLVVDFQPAGLKFSVSDPADLRMSFLEADEDFNDDGVVNSADLAYEAALSMWRREMDTSPWAKIQSTETLEAHEVEAPITGFTSYAIASG